MSRLKWSMHIPFRKGEWKGCIIFIYMNGKISVKYYSKDITSVKYTRKWSLRLPKEWKNSFTSKTLEIFFTHCFLKPSCKLSCMCFADDLQTFLCDFEGDRPMSPKIGSFRIWKMIPRRSVEAQYGCIFTDIDSIIIKLAKIASNQMSSYGNKIKDFN